ncbi:MAG: class I SAM-dependent methyltransferase [Chloroflexota bacterium]
MPNLNKLIYGLEYRLGTPRWDSGSVPPEVSALVASNHARTALDLGCGTGTSAIYLAQHGYSVVGVDFTSKAIEIARIKAQLADVQVDFRVGDVTRLDSLGVREPLDLVLDIGCFHGLDAAGRARYAEQLARLTHPDSTFLLWGFDGPAMFGTYGITSEQIRQQFAPHFAVTRSKRGEGIGKRVGVWFWLVRR